MKKRRVQKKDAFNRFLYSPYPYLIAGVVFGVSAIDSSLRGNSSGTFPLGLASGIMLVAFVFRTQYLKTTRKS
ncbi:hypothetical protein KJ765_03805 [Candidatus Micrarchaeota archaeon]|nr:hypothetical protein [Candidatus Micrarchaeota archaeon]